MKQFLKNSSFLLLSSMVLYSCNKPMESTPVKQCVDCQQTTYYYNGKDYTLSTTKEGTMFQDQNYDAFYEATEGREGLVEFSFGDEKVYFFDTEYDGYQYVEDNHDKLLGRKFKLSYRIEELSNEIRAAYGDEIDYTNPAIKKEIDVKIKSIFAEQHFTGELPQDLEAFLGIQQSQFAADRSCIFNLYEHTYQNGASLCVETASTANVVTYGPYNCYTMASISDLGLETMSGGTSWNDQASSAYVNYVSGADAMAVGFYKHRYFLATSCNSTVYFMSPNNAPFSNNLYVTDMSAGGVFFQQSKDERHPAWWCGTMNDAISSVKVLAVWSGCSTADMFDDMYN